MISINPRNITNDLKKVRVFSSIIEKKLSKSDKIQEHKIEMLSFEQLQDLNQLTSAAEYILSKYENNKEVYLLLKDFVDMIDNSTASMDILNDQIRELIVSAEMTISRIKTIQGDVSENYSLIPTNDVENGKKIDIQPKTSTNYLTKSTTAVYT
jgi:hypothetical protein